MTIKINITSYTKEQQTKLIETQKRGQRKQNKLYLEQVEKDYVQRKDEEVLEDNERLESTWDATDSIHSFLRWDDRNAVSTRPGLIGKLAVLDPARLVLCLRDKDSGYEFPSVMHAMNAFLCEELRDAEKFTTSGELGWCPFFSGDSKRNRKGNRSDDMEADLEVLVRGVEKLARKKQAEVLQKLPGKLEEWVMTIAASEVEFRDQLIAADPEDLIWRNNLYKTLGVVNGKGKNLYGEALRKVRATLRAEYGLYDDEGPWVKNQSSKNYDVNYFDGESEDDFELFCADGSRIGSVISY